jgi:hypothetical protein
VTFSGVAPGGYVGLLTMADLTFDEDNIFGDSFVDNTFLKHPCQANSCSFSVMSASERRVVQPDGNASNLPDTEHAWKMDVWSCNSWTDDACASGRKINMAPDGSPDVVSFILRIQAYPEDMEFRFRDEVALGLLPYAGTTDMNGFKVMDASPAERPDPNDPSKRVTQPITLQIIFCG